MTRRRHAQIPLNEHTNLEAEIARTLRRAILWGEYRPGDRLIELELAQRFNVSQGTIRGALKDLQAEGLVEYRPRRGNFVITIEEKDVWEISLLRDTLESLGARLAAQAINDEGRKVLDKIIKEMHRAARSGNRQRLIELDLEFHRTVIEISGHKRLRDLYKKIENQALLFLRMADHLHPNAQDIIALHEPLAEAIGKGDSKRAFGLAQRHSKGDASRIFTARRQTS